MTQQLKVLFIAAEAAPLIKVGGLGDVAGALPAALQALSEALELRIVIPLHGAIDRNQFELHPVTNLSIDHQDSPMTATVFSTQISGLQYYLISGEAFKPGNPGLLLRYPVGRA